MVVYLSSEIGSIMIVYNHIPDIQSLKIMSSFSKVVIIVDNNSQSVIKEKLGDICLNIGEKCVLLRNNENQGISKAYNQAILVAKSMGLKFVYFFDHDAIITPIFFLETLDALNYLISTNEKIGVITPIVADDKSLLGESFGIKCKYSKIGSAITSGILMNVDAFAILGGFNENYFVEGADYELTNRMRKNRFVIFRINKVLLIQTFEHPLTSSNFIIKALNYIIEIRSLYRVKIDNCNIYRTKLSYYNNRRKNELFMNLKSLYNEPESEKSNIAMIIVINYIESVISSVMMKIKGVN